MAFLIYVKLVLVITVYAVLRALVEANKASIWMSLACGAGAVWFIALGLPVTRDDSDLQSRVLAITNESSLIILMGLQLAGVTVLEVAARWLWEAVFNTRKKASKEFDRKNNQHESEGQDEDQISMQESEGEDEDQISMQESSMNLDEQEIDKRAEQFIANFYEHMRQDKGLEREAEISEQPKAITRPDKGLEREAEISELPKALGPQRASYSIPLFHAVRGSLVLIIRVLFQAALDAIAAGTLVLYERLKLFFKHYKEDINIWIRGGSSENLSSGPVQEDEKLLQESIKMKESKQKVVIKVSMNGHKSHSKAMKIAAGIPGVESAYLQGEDKNQLVVTGEGVDAVELMRLLRKNLGSAELINVSSVEEKKEGGGKKQPMEWPPLKELNEKTQRLTISESPDGLQLKAEPESSKQPKAIPLPYKGEESVRPKIEQYPTFDGQRQFISMCGLGLTESPNAEEWFDAEMIDLMDNELSNLPDEPICPKLYTLSLRENYKLRKIPSTFFTNMPLLQLLDLSNTSIMSLPKSVFELAHLKRLYLMKCEFLMVLPPEVGKLKRLEVLDMEGTEIFNLPVEIQELSALRRLRVSLYGCIHQDWQSSQSNSMFPFGVISALSTLQEVNIGINPDDERWDACVETIMKEVCDLSSLKILMFYFPKVKLLRDLEMVYPSLFDFRFIVGRHSKSIIPRLPNNVELELERLGLHNRCLKYINGEGVPEDIKKVLKHATAFQLDRHMTVKKLTEFGIENMEHLKGCLLGECNEIQVIIDGNDIHNTQIVCESSGDKRIGLESLEFMYIYYMKNLKRIWEGPVDEWSLSLLKSLTLSTCPQLITIFTLELLENLDNLNDITVRDCPAIKSLVSCEKGFKQSNYYLPKLRTISIHYVPELVSISSEVWLAPELREMSLYNCPKLKSLSIMEVSSKHLENITGETDWWEALEWTQVQRGQFDRIFVPINADTCF